MLFLQLTNFNESVALYGSCEQCFDHEQKSLPYLSESVPSIRKQVRRGKNDKNLSIQATKRDDLAKGIPELDVATMGLTLTYK